MIIAVSDKSGNGFADEIIEIFRKNESYFEPENPDRRLVIVVVRDGELDFTEILPGKVRLMDSCVSLDDLLPSLPEEMQEEILSAK